MIFRLSADGIFEAADIEDALRLLGEHLTDVADGVESEFEFEGELEIRPVRADDD